MTRTGSPEACRSKERRDVLQPPVHAILLHPPFGDSFQHVLCLATKRFALKLDIVLPLYVLDELLGAERNQHAEYNDPHLADECTPAVQRFGKVKMHATGPQAVTGA